MSQNKRSSLGRGLSALMADLQTEDVPAARESAQREAWGPMTPAPVIQVSGRLFPVEQRWRPYEERKDADLDDAIADAVDELWRGGQRGDILVFLPGEREIREAAEALRKHAFGRGGVHPEILPLFARLSAEEQSRIFRPHSGRRIVLATNVAETSLTVPGIRYVIDTGLARVKRYSYRNKVEQLQVEGISQAAARQRAGRCGRVAAGVCVRLYDEADFNARPAFTDPEILRSSLAGVILRMKSLKLTDVESFPFIEPPPAKAISDGYALLQELGALDDDNRLTRVGEALAKLPLDPRIGRGLDDLIRNLIEQLGGRVVYKEEDLDAWVKLGKKKSTSDPGTGTVLPAKRHAPIPYAGKERR